MNLPEDLEPIWKEGNSAFAGAPALFRGGSFDDILDAFAAGNVVVHLEDGKPVGFATIVLSPGDFVGIGNLVVSADFRRQGIASKLVEEAHELARQKGAKHSVMLIWDGETLPAFYQKAGYQPVGVVMSREL